MRFNTLLRCTTTASVAALLTAVACASGPSGGPAHAAMTDVAGEVRSFPGTGVRYQDVQEGGGQTVERGRCVYTHYTVYRANGQFVETSHDSGGGTAGEPVAFVLGSGRVIRGWDIGIEGMKVGGIRRLWVPEDLAYGAAGSPPRIPPHVALIFDVQLMATEAARNGACPSWKSIR